MRREEYQDPMVWLVSKGADRLTEGQVLAATVIMFAIGLIIALLR